MLFEKGMTETLCVIFWSTTKEDGCTCPCFSISWVLPRGFPTHIVLLDIPINLHHKYHMCEHNTCVQTLLSLNRGSNAAPWNKIHNTFQARPVWIQQNSVVRCAVLRRDEIAPVDKRKT